MKLDLHRRKQEDKYNGKINMKNKYFTKEI